MWVDETYIFGKSLEILKEDESEIRGKCIIGLGGMDALS